ncbi:hypothetical protein Cylst_1162 [Cylindrospermum stagnale PCC 7417]|uniref:Uncharacterized protein n=1 Tax=Cylindrospermum stagnale PCC 7417 TaxID=56107 RepID=K9WSV2_9NOST|nr:hypothetical protein [Cylindrospermum stagnale]AFZ23465.1 hypothetical protein Cylst_1162 [Cylindrospermum stagnale PCC 7417]
MFIPRRPTTLIKLRLMKARWAIRHSRVFISSPPYRLGERLLLFKLKRDSVWKFAAHQHSQKFPARHNPLKP